MLTLKNRFYRHRADVFLLSLSLSINTWYIGIHICMYAHHHILLYIYIYIHTYVRYILVSNIVEIHYLQSTIWTQQSPNRQVQILPSLPSQQPKPRRRSPNNPKKRSRSAKSQKSRGIGPGKLFECKIKGKLPGFKCLNIVIKEGESHWVDETNTRIQETTVFPRTYMEKKT